MDIVNYVLINEEYKGFEKKVKQKMFEFVGLGYYMLQNDEVGVKD